MSNLASKLSQIAQFGCQILPLCWGDRPDKQGHKLTPICTNLGHFLMSCVIEVLGCVCIISPIQLLKFSPFYQLPQFFFNVLPKFRSMCVCICDHSHTVQPRAL